MLSVGLVAAFMVVRLAIANLATSVASTRRSALWPSPALQPPPVHARDRQLEVRQDRRCDVDGRSGRVRYRAFLEICAIDHQERHLLVAGQPAVLAAMKVRRLAG